MGELSRRRTLNRRPNREPDGWAEAERTLRKLHPSTLGPNSKPFAVYAWKPFLVDEVVLRLTSAESYGGQHSVLRAGLAAWMLRPYATSLVRNAIALEVMKKMAVFEDEASTSRFSANMFQRETAARLALPGPDFVRDIYYGIGGLRSAWGMASPAQQQRALAMRASSLPSLLGVMGIMHFQNTQMGRLPTLPSLQRSSWALAAVLALRERSKNKDNILKETRLHIPAAAFLYAASRIAHTGGTSLLEAIVASPLEHDLLLRHWDELIGMVAYVIRNVIAPMRECTMKTLALAYLPKVEPVPFDAPSFSTPEIGAISKALNPRNPQFRSSRQSKSKAPHR